MLIWFIGTKIYYDPIEFENKINEYFKTGQYPLVDGYAPFCKHLFVPNFADVKCAYTKITESTRFLIKSGYESRRENELPVLVQWIDKEEVEQPLASHLDIILYRLNFNLNFFI